MDSDVDQDLASTPDISGSESQPLLSDPAFYIPDEMRERDLPELPQRRDYQLRGGEQVDPLPVIRDYRLRGDLRGATRDDLRDDSNLTPPAGEPEPEPVSLAAEPEAVPLPSEPEVVPLPSEPEAVPLAAEAEPVTPADESHEVALESMEAHADPESELMAGAEPQDIPARSLLDDEPEEKPGFFARLFGRKRKVERVESIEPRESHEPVAEVENREQAPESDALPEPVEPPVRLDRPSLEFFMRVDRAATPAGNEAIPSIDDALPMASAPEEAPPQEEPQQQEPEQEELEQEEPESIEASATATDTDVPTDPWISAIPEPEAKPGFFARLFRRRSMEQPTHLHVEPAADTAPEADRAEEPLAAAEAAFARFDQSPDLVAQESFASVDDALPAAPTAEELYNQRFAPASNDELVLQPFTTLDMDTPAVAPPDLGVTMQEPPAVARSTVQVALDDDTDTGEMVPPTPPEISEAQEAERPPFFVPKFRAFYNEIVSHKLQKAEFTAGFATAVMDYTADISPDAAAQALQKRLCEILELQAAEASWMGGEAAARFPDAQYAMAALADEVFTHIEWPGREGWPRHMVEQRLFRSNAKDVEFFKRVDRLLKNEGDHPSPAAKDLARMYLLVLAAGFQGKYRPFGLTRPLAEYRRRLYEFVSGKDPLMIYAEERKLFPEAAERVVVGRAVSRFSMLQQWAAVLVILLIGYAVISQMAWNRVSAELRDVTARVEAANSSATSDGVAVDPQ